jgi:hypothetical protein
MLNLLNRAIVVLLLIVLFVISLAVAFTPEGVASFAADQLSLVKIDAFSVERLIITFVSLAIAVLCVILLRFQFRRRRPESVILTGGGATELASESVVQRLRQDVEAVAQVRQVIPHISGSGKAVNVTLEVRTDPDVDVPAKAGEVDQVARESVERLGLKLGRLRTKIVVGRGSATPLPPA